jgi:hypothetical protein
MSNFEGFGEKNKKSPRPLGQGLEGKIKARPVSVYLLAPGKTVPLYRPFQA